ncbi:hypothetical protein ATCC90586_003162 [Pythium insidiosum]|nr:hypothetical protein ATCC90586_003162 [Pythium insidiosum]
MVTLCVSIGAVAHGVPQQYSDNSAGSADHGYFVGDSVLSGEIVFELALMDDLVARARQDQFGSRLTEFEARYAHFRQLVRCASWQEIQQRQLSRDQIIDLLTECQCSKLRSSLVDAVDELYPDAVQSAKQGQVAQVYISKGSRIASLEHWAVALLDSPAMARRFDERVQQCFTDVLRDATPAQLQRYAFTTELRSSSLSHVPYFAMCFVVLVGVVAGIHRVGLQRNGMSSMGGRRSSPAPKVVAQELEAIIGDSSGTHDELRRPD